MLYLPISVVCVNSDPVETVTISKAAWKTLYIVVYIYLVVSYSFLRNPIVATVQAMRIPYLTPLFILVNPFRVTPSRLVNPFRIIPSRLVNHFGVTPSRLIHSGPRCSNV